jgi:hypothetical protein
VRRCGPRGSHGSSSESEHATAAGAACPLKARRSAVRRLSRDPGAL